MSHKTKEPDMSDARVSKPDSASIHLKSKESNSHTGAQNNEFKYRISDRRPGVVIIFNHGIYGESRYDRKYWEQDKENMKKIWKDKNFEVMSADNLAISEIAGRIRNVAKKDYGDDSCFVCVIHTHGSEGQLLAYDGWYPTQSLFEPFLSDGSKWHGKPKLFLIQACLGTKAESNVTVTDSVRAKSFSLSAPQVIPRYNDLLVVRSTTYGFVSFRSGQGSWFLKALYDTMKEWGQLDFEKMLTLVKYTVARGYESHNLADLELNEKKQTVSVMSTLTKKLYLKQESLPDALIYDAKSDTSFLKNVGQNAQTFYLCATITEPIDKQKSYSFNFSFN